MFHASRSAVPLWHSVFVVALSTLVASCSTESGSGVAEPGEATNAVAPVLRTANGQQVFGSSAGAPSSGTEAPSPGSVVSAPPGSSTPMASSEALTDPVLVSPDAGADSSPPPTARPSPSATPQPSAAPSAASDDDDDDDDEAEDDD